MLTTEIISKEALVDELNKFRDILINYDFSEISNIVFFDVQSLNIYLKTHDGNPFERQYEEIEKILNKIISYLPTTISNDTIELLTEILDSKYQNKEVVRENILFNIKMDFIDRVRAINSNDEWNKLLLVCEKIRAEKEAQNLF